MQRPIQSYKFRSGADQYLHEGPVGEGPVLHDVPGYPGAPERGPEPQLPAQGPEELHQVAPQGPPREGQGVGHPGGDAGDEVLPGEGVPTGMVRRIVEHPVQEAGLAVAGTENVAPWLPRPPHRRAVEDSIVFPLKSRKK